MQRRVIVALASLIVLAGVALSPAVSSAQFRRFDDRDDGRDRRPRLRTTLPERVVRPPFIRGPIVGFGFVPPPPAYPPPRVRYYDSSVYVGSPGYYDVWAYAPPPPAYVPPSPGYEVGPPGSALPDASATPTVIEYPEGRYELRGDGISAPYRWVWIPKPPAGPPPSAPGTPAAPATPNAPATPRAPLTLYRWVDDQGAVHWTDRLEAVPDAYRSKATKSPS